MKIIEMRDRLFHAGDGPSDERLEYETLRIRTLVVRLLFRMLGWSGDVPYPPNAGLSWLRRYWGHDLPWPAVVALGLQLEKQLGRLL